MATGTGGKGSTPGVPDYMGAANLMGQQSMYNTQYQTYANRPDINTPWGSVNWTPPPGGPSVPPPGGTGGAGGAGVQVGVNGAGNPVDAQGNPIPNPPTTWDGAAPSFFSEPSSGGVAPGYGGAGGAGAPGNYPTPGTWEMNMTLSPAQQAALDAQQSLGASRSDLAQTMFGRAQSELGAAPDWGSLPGAPDANAARQQAIDAVYGQAQSRLDPQWNQRGDALRTQLMNEGLRPGMQGYDQRMQEFERGRTDAYDTAMRSAVMAGEPVAAGEFGRGLQGRQQGIAELLQRRGMTLNEINALMGGQQVGMPQMPGFSQAGMAQTPDYLGAMGNQYGAQLNQYNAGQAQLQSQMGGMMNMLPYFFML